MSTLEYAKSKFDKKAVGYTAN